MKKTFDWNQQTTIVLNHLLDVLCQCLKAWDNFTSPNGDIGYFLDIDTSPGKPHSGIEVSLQAINDSIETLEGLRDKLEQLTRKCRNSAKDLQLRLTLEANEAVRNNGDFTHFTVSVIFSHPYTYMIKLNVLLTRQTDHLPGHGRDRVLVDS